MICESCKKREATVHMSNVINGKKTEHHLCSLCAQKQGVLDSMHSHGLGASLFEDDFFSNDFFTHAVYPEELLARRQVKACPQCGMTLEDFNRSGKFGCDACYKTFADQIAPLLKRLQQGATTYEGRVPKRGNNVFRKRYEIKECKKELAKAIAAENYEKAASLRDSIKELESLLSQGAQDK